MVWTDIICSGHHFFDDKSPQIMAKTDFKEYVCRPYCTFYREESTEEISCLGAIIAERLVVSGRIDPAEIPALTKAPHLWEKHDEDLGKIVCSRCLFREKDCDFRSDELYEGLEPCGGFILLAHLKENNLIDETDLEQNCE
jgi:hypothetical protein